MLQSLLNKISTKNFPAFYIREIVNKLCQLFEDKHTGVIINILCNCSIKIIVIVRNCGMNKLKFD